MNSPARDSRRSARPWDLPTSPPPGGFAGKPFRAALVCYQPVSGAFHPPLGVLFTFRSRYWYAIGLGTYLALEASGPRLPAPYPRCGTLGHAASSLQPSPTGLSPSMAPHSRGLRLGLQDGPATPITPHSPTVTHGGSVWAAPLSVAPTEGISF